MRQAFDPRVWSASFPLVIEWHGDQAVVVPAPDPRPWNGRKLTPEEFKTCKMIFLLEYLVDPSHPGLAAQEVLEWLSEYAW